MTPPAPTPGECWCLDEAHFHVSDLEASYSRGRAAGLEEAEKSVPTNWCDSLLQRPGKKLTDPWSSQDIERLLSAIAAALRALGGGGD